MACGLFYGFCFCKEAISLDTRCTIDRINVANIICIFNYAIYFLKLFSLIKNNTPTLGGGIKP